MNCDQFEVLISGYLDGELSKEDEERLLRHLEVCPKCRNSLEELKRLKEVASKMKLTEPPKEIWDSYWERISNRITRGIGWILFIIGAALIAGYGIYQFATEPATSAFVKLCTFAIIVGFALLLVSVLWERIKEAKTDKYKGVYK
ncbi:MAG: zf-HC2 domain-containing protein [Acidobacteria bacterium]|nr:zf-HC2 domain-containing protein [Acidobacteriota bacterium]